MMTFINGSCGLIVSLKISEFGVREEVSERPFLAVNPLSPL